MFSFTAVHSLLPSGRVAMVFVGGVNGCSRCDMTWASRSGGGEGRPNAVRTRRATRPTGNLVHGVGRIKAPKIKRLPLQFVDVKAAWASRIFEGFRSARRWTSGRIEIWSEAVHLHKWLKAMIALKLERDIFLQRPRRRPADIQETLWKMFSSS